MQIIAPSSFDFEQFKKIPQQKRFRGNQRTKRKKIYYKDIVTAFDIETTTIDEITQAVMYIWQWAFGPELVVVGRTWEEFAEFRDKLLEALGEEYLVVYVHNLSFEFQWLRSMYDFEPEDVFAIESRKILKCNMKHIEFRCSYLHSNMSLAAFTKQMNVEHGKLSGEDFDYSKKRYPWTSLSDSELQYCVNDVIGLVEAISYEMEKDGDNMYTIPLTSTGYVRRDAKKAMTKVKHTYVKDQLPNWYTYCLLREAFRGGNCHANRLYAGKIIKNVHSADRSSSYPDVLCNCKYPVSRFYHRGRVSVEELMYYMEKRGKACLIRIAFYNIRLADDFWPCPYLSRDKCRNIENGIYDNGRIISADYLETTITDIDFRIIASEYDFDNMIPFDLQTARYGKLPQAFIDCIIDYYNKKTSLKGVKDETGDAEYLYGKSKNKLNSLYGMTAQDPVKFDIIFKDNDFVLDTEKLGSDILEEHNKHAFLAYQWGVWVTAWARYRLEEGIRLAGDNFVYADTDSVKYIGKIDWRHYNKERRQDSISSGAKAKDAKGKWHYMGVYESDGEYSEFVTLGAKKYAYVEDGELHVTVSGVSKKNGAKELGDIRNFKEGFIFSAAGGTESVYNDTPEITEYEIDGHKLHIISNVVIKDSTYTLGTTAEYKKLITFYQNVIDRHYKI